MTASALLDVVGSPRVAWLVAAVALQAGSMSTFARLQRRVLAETGLRVSARSALVIAYAGNAVAMTIPFAGTTASAAFTYRQYRGRGATGAMAGWTMAVAGVVSTSTFALLIGLGALGEGDPVAAGIGVAGIAAATLPIVAIVLALRSDRWRRRLERPAVFVLRLTRRVSSVPRRDPAEVVARTFTQLSTFRLRRRSALMALGLAALNWLLDALCLWAVLQAFDVALPVRSLPLVYAAAIAAASLGVTPAGIGTVEAAIAVALTHLGTTAASGLLAALVYRGISTWLVVLVGWVVLAALRRRATVVREPADVVPAATEGRISPRRADSGRRAAARPRRAAGRASPSRTPRGRRWSASRCTGRSTASRSAPRSPAGA